MSSISETRLAELWNLAVSQTQVNDLRADEALTVRHFSKMNSAASSVWESAPRRAVMLAHSIMQAQSRRILFAALIRPQHAHAVRGSATQVAFEAENVKVRLQFEQADDRCRVWGRINETGFSVWTSGNRHAVTDSGDFEFECDMRDLEPFAIQNDESTIVLPVNFLDTSDGSQ